MGNKKSVKTNSEWVNVWQKNGIPPLEFCSIERAAQLIDCQVSDIYHWINIGKLYPAIFIENNVDVTFSIYLKGDECDDDVLVAAAYASVNRPSIINLHRGSEPGAYGDGIIEEGYKYCYPDGGYSHGVNRLYLSGTICGLWLPSFYSLWRRGDIQTIKSDNSIFPPDEPDDGGAVLVAALDESIDVSASNLMILRKDIERIFDCGKAGRELEKPMSLNASSEEITGQPKERTTANQSTYIKFLLLLSGFTNDDLMKSPATLKDIISRKARNAGIGAPEVSNNTISAWLSKARDIDVIKKK
ncbi:hypothetical protein I9723_002540 [Morganella morganii]|nr:hypothetical protein [Morganella morganii]